MYVAAVVEIWNFVSARFRSFFDVVRRSGLMVTSTSPMATTVAPLLSRLAVLGRGVEMSVLGFAAGLPAVATTTAPAESVPSGPRGNPRRADGTAPEPNGRAVLEGPFRDIGRSFSTGDVEKWSPVSSA
jgi:hypothetical protein